MKSLFQISLFVVLVAGAWGPAHAQLERLPETDPRVVFLSGFIDPLIAGDAAAATAYWRDRHAPEVEAEEIRDRVETLMARVHERGAPRIDGWMALGGGAHILAELTNERYERLLVGIAASALERGIAGFVSSGDWAITMGPHSAVAELPGLLDPPLVPRHVAFVGVNVIPMDAERVLQNRTVVVEDGRIVRVGDRRRVRVPRGSLVIDGRGKYLVPGLAEMHAHIPVPPPHPMQSFLHGEGAVPAAMFLYVAHGVTTIRGMQGHPAHFELRSRSAEGEILAPRIFTSGATLNENTVPDEETAAAAVAKQADEGADHLKLQHGPSREVFDAIVAAAQEHSLPVTGHVWSMVGLDHTLAAGQSTIEHLDGYLESLAGHGSGYTSKETGFYGLGAVDDADPARMTGVARATRDAGTWNVATMSWVQQLLSPEHTLEELLARPELKYLPADAVENWRVYTVARRMEDSGPEPRRARHAQLRREMLGELHRAGAGLLLGSDSPQLWNVPGASLRHELQIMVDAGLSPYEALVTGTRNPAVYYGTEEWGTVAEGRVADLVLLDGNPLEDVAHVQAVAGVMLRGTWLPREFLDAGLVRIERAVAAPAP